MNSVHRVGVAVATVAAAITVSGAVIVRGAMPGAPAQSAIYPAASSAPKIVYISAARPAPVTTPAPPAPTDAPQIIYQVVAGSGGDDGGGSGD
jgi:hypothetical protein